MATGLPKKNWGRKLSKLRANRKAFRLSYDNKKQEKDILSGQKVNFTKIYGKTDENRLYFGDNLQVLHLLKNENKIKGKVKLVYIDPPFATKQVFKTRSLKDAYTDILEGSEYIEFLRERIIIIKELLANDGSIYLHLDGNMAFEMKIVMDEIFEKKNFRNWITRKKCNVKNYTKNVYGNISDYIMFYSKTNNYIWNRPHEPWTEDKKIEQYPFTEKETGRRYKRVPLHAPGKRNGETGRAWRGTLPPKGKHWQFVPERLEELDRNGEIYWSKTGNPRRKVYIDKSQGIPNQDIWLNFRDIINQNTLATGYPTEKNIQMLSLIIEASSNPGDIILDCFSGSGTTLVASASLGRKWIGVDNSLEAIETTLDRFSTGTSRLGDFVSKNKPTKNIDFEKINNFSLLGSKDLDNKVIERLIEVTKNIFTK